LTLNAAIGSLSIYALSVVAPSIIAGANFSSVSVRAQEQR